MTSLPHATLKEDLTLEGYTIPKDAAILANIYPIHFDPEYFPDPYTFRLDHVLTDDNQFINQERILPFSIGMLEHFLLLRTLEEGKKTHPT